MAASDRSSIGQRIPTSLAVGLAAVLIVGGLGAYLLAPSGDETKGTGINGTSEPTTGPSEARGGFADVSASMQVEPDVEPRQETIPPGPGRDEPRPVARLEDDDGMGADFVEDEVIIFEPSETVDELLERWDAEPLVRFDPSDAFPNATVNESEDAPLIDRVRYLVRVNVSRIDLTGSQEALDRVDPGADYRLSSEAGAGLVSLVARGLDDGLDIGLNWIPESHTFKDGETEETSTDDGSYTDAFDWDYMNADAPRDAREAAQATGTPIDNHNVTEAWKLLEDRGDLDAGVKLAIIDGGFAANPDLPDLQVGGADLGTPNPLPCGFRTTCPWHGTGVASAALAVPDNQLGTAGPAGPVAEGVLLGMEGGPAGGPVMAWYSVDNLIRAAVDIYDADIISLSFGMTMPGVGKIGYRQMDDAIKYADHNDVLVFTSAGNDGKNVDASRRVLDSEKRDIVPCEIGPAICVGGLDSRSAATTFRGQHVAHPNSNYGTNHHGHKTVELWGPHCMWIAPAPDASSGVVPDGRVWGCGTSYAAPFVAGVAALVLAADPSLSPGEVKWIMYQTAHRTSDEEVNRIVNALGAVRGALDYNLPPDVEITFPEEGAHYSRTRVHRAFASVTDYEDGSPATPRTGMPRYPVAAGVDPTGDEPRTFEEHVTWELDGRALAATGERVDLPGMLDPGLHTLEVTMTDSGGKTDQDTVQFTVYDRAPQVEILAPVEGSKVAHGSSLTFRASTNDPDRVEPVPDRQVVWSSDVDGLLGRGHEFSTSDLSLGVHTITVEARDADGDVSTKRVWFRVQEACPGSESGSSIAQPTAGARFDAGRWEEDTFLPDRSANAHEVTFQGWGCHSDGTRVDEDHLRWKVRFSADGRTYTRDLGTGEELTHDLYAYASCPDSTTYEVILQAFADGTWHVTSHDVEVRTPVC